MSNEKNKKILLIFTGGTICSFADEEGEKRPDAKEAEVLIESIFRRSDSVYKDAKFDERTPIDILSENMTPDVWNKLISEIKKYDINEYKGVIILHGTDSLAYTAAMLSLVLAGAKVPVFLVSSQLPLNEENANGNDNFRIAIELIMNGIKPNVYVAYKNMDGRMLVHLGSHLTQCPNHSNDFSSLDAWYVEDIKNASLEGWAWETDEPILEKIGKFSSAVLKVVPYVGLDYSRIKTEGVAAIVHGTYHSQTLCTDKSKTPFSVFALTECFGEDAEIPLFLEPCSYEPDKKISCYETTADAVKEGAVAVWGMTSEMVYVKTLVGVALGYKKNELKEFVNEKKVNYEFHF